MTTAWPANTHPARLILRFGVSEVPAALAVVALAMLQYVFVAQLWRGYPLKAVGDVIHPNVVAAGLVATVLGGALIVIVSSLRWKRGLAAARRLEVAASSKSFDAIRTQLEDLASRSTLEMAPALRYTPKNAGALEVREATRGSSRAVVVGLEQRKRQMSDRDAFAAQLGHEISHLELASTATETGARKLVILHFRVLGWVVMMFLLVLGFIDRRGLRNEPRLWGFEAVWDKSLYASMTYHLALLALSSLVVLVYSYYFAVRREHIHDFRGSQLAGSDVLAERVFSSQAARMSPWKALLDFAHLHPSATSRHHAVRERDFILMSAVLYPLVVAAAQPLALLLMTGWQDVFGLERQWWNLTLTVLTGLVLYLVVCADVARLGLGALLRRRLWLKVPLYALLAGVATQIPRFVLEIVFGVRKGLSAEVIFERIWTGILTGGGKIALMVATVLFALAYLAAVRIAASGEARAGRHANALHVVGGIMTVGAFSAVSLTSAAFIVDVLVVLTIGVIVMTGYLVIRGTCSACGRNRLGAARLRTRCACGQEQLVLTRKWTDLPYSRHVVADAATVPAA